MTKINDGGPVYPSEQGRLPDGTWNQTWECGMTLRQWYAGMALIGLLSDGGWNLQAQVDQVSAIAFDFADSMIAHERKEQTDDSR